MSEGSSVTIVPLGDGRYRVDDGSRSRLAYAVHDGARVWVFVDGAVHVVADGAERTARGAVVDDESALSAPMPATVIDVKVEPGRSVARGDVLIMLEAMKMELPIKAPRDGTVTAVACKRGDLVQPGVRLLDLQ